MAQPTTDATAPASLLLALPAALLASTFEYLEPAELIRTLTLTTKHPALARFVHSNGVEAAEASLWTCLLRQRLEQFTPARAWFDLRGNEAHDNKIMRECFPQHARLAERKLTSMLEAAGLAGAEWAWEGPRSQQRLGLTVPSVPFGKTMKDFLAWADAFSCRRCNKHGAATTQCARCYVPLCTDCTSGCEAESVLCGDGGRMEKCPFALCNGCSRFRRSIYSFYGYDNPPLGYVTPTCTRCPPGIRWCHAHPDPGFLTCWWCMERRCNEHTGERPIFKYCSVCDFQGCLCARRKCHESGFHTQWGCNDCDRLTCGRCLGESRVCPHCGGDMERYKPYLENEGGEEGEEEGEYFDDSSEGDY
jgi:hypothetical protein